MIQFKQVKLRRGKRVLFSGADFMIPRGAKTGIVGRNGTGKSSLLGLLTGELHVDAGDVEFPCAATLAYVSQDIPLLDRAALEYVIDGDAALRNVEHALTEAESQGDGHLIARLHGDIETLDGYTATSRAAQLLQGLGFAQAELERPVNQFSGGWRMRLNLAQALMCRSDILLLDEPTNHLDMEAVIWLERWLKAYEGTLLLIAHDQEFLESVVDHVVHLEHEEVKLYRGDFTSFERQHAAECARQANLFVQQQREIKKIQSFVDRFRAKATKARQAQSRLKALERMDLIAAAHADSPLRFEFPTPERLPNPLIKLEDVSVGYGNGYVLRDVSLSLRPGMRVGLLGRNGAGKSTLIKLIAGVLSPAGGHVEPMPGLQLGYFAQHQLEALDAQASPLVHMRRVAPRTPDQRLKDYLGGYEFGGERVDFSAGQLSGGEKARLALALLIWQAPNLLLLDEPTNHLDLEMRYTLNLALQGFEGALILVSHDRHLLRTVSDELWWVREGRVDPFRGDLDDYGRQDELPAQLDVPEPAEPIVEMAADRKLQRREEARRRERRQPLVQRLKRLERSIEKVSSQREHLDRVLADAKLYEPENKADLREHMHDRARITSELEELESEWLEVQDELDEMDRVST